MYQQDRFVSDLYKSGQIHKLVFFHSLQHIIPTFTLFFFYPSRKVDDRQNKFNAQAVDMKSDPSPATTYSCMYLPVQESTAEDSGKGVSS
jgi:hypothetical protein